eukprot:2974195-Amphidinium_carterae.1
MESKLQTVPCSHGGAMEGSVNSESFTTHSGPSSKDCQNLKRPVLNGLQCGAFSYEPATEHPKHISCY